MKNQAKLIVSLIFIGLGFLSLFVGSLFRVMHWAGGRNLTYIGIGVVITGALILIFRKKE